jgi:ankyrin repeat protein
MYSISPYCRWQFLLAVNLLLENGANVSGIDGRWALQSWLLYEYSWPQQVSTRILKLLASYGIELNYSDLNPLQRAAYTGNLDSVQLLLDGVPLQKNKEKELEEKFGKVRASYFSLLPLDIRKKVFSKAMVNIQTNKANPNIIDRHGNTALYHARQGFRLVEGKPMSRLSKHHPIFNMNFYRNNTINAVKIKNFIEIIDLLKDKMDPSLIPYSTDGY